MGISNELAQKACDALVAYWTGDDTDSAVKVAEVLDEILVAEAQNDPSLVAIIDQYDEAMQGVGLDPAPDVPPDGFEDLSDDSAAIEDLIDAEAAFDYSEGR